MVDRDLLDGSVGTLVKSAGDDVREFMLRAAERPAISTIRKV
jgi:hypothetical protein